MCERSRIALLGLVITSLESVWGKQTVLQRSPCLVEASSMSASDDERAVDVVIGNLIEYAIVG